MPAWEIGRQYREHQCPNCNGCRCLTQHWWTSNAATRSLKVEPKTQEPRCTITSTPALCVLVFLLASGRWAQVPTRASRGRPPPLARSALTTFSSIVGKSHIKMPQGVFRYILVCCRTSAFRPHHVLAHGIHGPANAYGRVPLPEDANPGANSGQIAHRAPAPSHGAALPSTHLPAATPLLCICVPFAITGQRPHTHTRPRGA